MAHGADRKQLALRTGRLADALTGNADKGQPLLAHRVRRVVGNRLDKGGATRIEQTQGPAFKLAAKAETPLPVWAGEQGNAAGAAADHANQAESGKGVLGSSGFGVCIRAFVRHGFLRRWSPRGGEQGTRSKLRRGIVDCHGRRQRAYCKSRSIWRQRGRWLPATLTKGECGHQQSSKQQRSEREHTQDRRSCRTDC